MHVAVAAERQARPLAEKVAERIGGRHPARELARELSVERGDDIVRAEREPGPGGDCLLASARVDRPRNPALPVERDHAVLEQPLEQDEPEQREPVGVLH